MTIKNLAPYPVATPVATTYPVATTVPAQVIADTLDSAFAGGSAYWARARLKREAEGAEYLYEHAMLGGEVTITDREDSSRCWALTAGAVQSGVQRMAHSQPRHFADMVAGNGDATTGDVLLQLCIFGEVLYG